MNAMMTYIVGNVNLLKSLLYNITNFDGGRNVWDKIRGPAII